MPSCKSSDAVRVKPWLAHTPQPDEPPPDQPGEPDAPPIGDPPTQPGEVPHSARVHSTLWSPPEIIARAAPRLSLLAPHAAAAGRT